MENTCTAADVKQIVHDELLATRGRFVSQFWYVLLGLFITSAGAWFSLYFQVQSIQQELARTQTETTKQYDGLRADYKADVEEIKTDVRFIRDTLIKQNSPKSY